MSSREDIFTRVAEQIEPFNKKGIDLTEAPASPAISNGTA
jgi:acyl carrier protein